LCHKGLKAGCCVRVDTTVVVANFCYPTDAGLLAKAISKLARTIQRVQTAGGATRTHARDRRRAHRLARSLRARTGEAKQQVAAQAAADAARIARNAAAGSPAPATPPRAGWRGWWAT
jgi:transposase, IS5 family